MSPLTYSIEEAAERLGPAFTVDWLRGHIKEIPKIRAGKGSGRGGRIAFTEAHLIEIVAMYEVRPAPAPAPGSSIVTRHRRS